MNGGTSNLLGQFRALLHESEVFFCQCSQECTRSASGRDSRQIVGWLDEIYKSLLIKVYVFIAEADQRWSLEEKQFCEVLFDFIWPCGDHRQNLREAAGRVFAVAGNLKWSDLFRPFSQYPALHKRAGELEHILVQMANLVAKADGQVTTVEIERLRILQDEIDLHLKRPVRDANTAGSRGTVYSKPTTPRGSGPPGYNSAPCVSPPAPTTRPQPPQPGSVTSPKSLPSPKDTDAELTLAEPIHDAGPAPEERLTQELARLDQLIGLGSVKNEVRTLVNFLKLQTERTRAGLPSTKLNLHMVFTGNPGTGKTTVGRIIGSILGAMGILAKGHLVETDRSGLVAEYAGQTAIKTNKKVDEAMDGVLFIDEAYSLTAEGNEDPYGNEAVQSLLKRMEDDRKRIVVILAGYSKRMERLLRSNPGLSSRFNTKLEFEDYAPRDLGRIFQSMCDEHHYHVHGGVQAKLLVEFQLLFNERDEHFGNARLVRNIFETAVRRLANRIAGTVSPTTEMLTTFDASDLVFPTGRKSPRAQVDYDEWRFEIECDACSAKHPSPGNLLGRRVRCLKCQHEFQASWGVPIRRDSTTSETTPRNDEKTK